MSESVVSGRVPPCEQGWARGWRWVCEAGKCVEEKVYTVCNVNKGL